MKNEAKIQMRMPGDLRDWFKEYSQQRNRSMNGQLIELIKEKQAEEKGKAPSA
ncbi:Arc family DNA-binding protein [Paraburkholderia sp. Tr-20389]|uniref:Arc family DNA-binding protein n=1 Tax=Paraburkholderia sp. Tr-20389 TaxID=2703903 RepID=UPI00197ED1E9|nr:Arc family DNA-binding protein [Paraburkholderia sp. Tr-20389]MBN3757241.1 Arc family DNA-binding protein [Paraburkholderia sp. Tr-20389]